VINDRSDLKFGDLVFFNTRRRVRPGHVGIYIGDNLFAHASSKLGVTISSLDYDYYSKRYMGARRVDSTNVLN
jgi:cell wall-associated NlpC family hydrolase